VVGEVDPGDEEGVDAKRIVVGGFSQGCAVSLVWGNTGRWRDRLGGVVYLSGYFPLAGEIEWLREEKVGGAEEGEREEVVLGAWDEGYDGANEAASKECGGVE
jgi:hypothetical protein